jgi:hypothetical protein
MGFLLEVVVLGVLYFTDGSIGNVIRIGALKKWKDLVFFMRQRRID